jgi:hypothetical protein
MKEYYIYQKNVYIIGTIIASLVIAINILLYISVL